MVKISIISLIYKSTEFCDWVYDSVMEFTPKIKSGEAEFFFVANDPTEKVVAHLQRMGYPHVVQRNNVYSDADRFDAGYAKPEYIGRVYAGYNRGIIEAKGELIVLINSDHFFSPDWLEGLLKFSDRKNIVSSTLVERKHPDYDVFPGAIHGEFGNHPANFQKEHFLKFAAKIRKTGLEHGKAYMPCLFHRDNAILAGLYPEGNLADKSPDRVYQHGDVAFFSRLSKMGVKHLTSLDSVVYHLKEGELDADDIEITPTPLIINEGEKRVISGWGAPIKLASLPISITPTSEHYRIIRLLLNKHVPYGAPRNLVARSFYYVKLNIRSSAIRILRTFGLLDITKKIFNK